MARLIGKIQPQDMSGVEYRLYKFLTRELPDYISVGFRVVIGKYELDAVLLVPHMGVFILDIRGTNALIYQDGVFFTQDPLGNTRVFNPLRTKRLQREMLEYMRKHFHIHPLVYELNCFPLLELDENMRFQLQDYADHFLSQKDFVNARTFLLTLFKYSTASVNLSSSNEMIENDPRFYDDLDDDLVYEITNHWGEQPVECKRPSKPPVVFLSYNRNNQSTAKK